MATASEYEIPDGKRLLATSRQVLDRSLTLGLVFHLTGDERYASRLWRELEAAADFKDWNPSHFLDTAEMTAAFGIAYDWLHANWTPGQRTILRKAIVAKGLTPSLSLYRKDRGWVAAEHNWNQVCNGGMTLGALAIVEEEPALAGEILERAIATVPRAMKHFAPDGAWGEGPGYWDYATKYNVLMLAGLDSAFGQDFRLSRIEGFNKAPDFAIQTVGPLGRSFNYADAGEGPAGGPQMLWFASKFDVSRWAAWRLDRITNPQSVMRTRPTALDLLWGAKWISRERGGNDLPLAKHFHGPEVVTMRSSWNDLDATFVGFKGGDNRVNHGHLDLGSFVLDANGRRWGMDLGPDDYNLPGYFGKARWDFYRLRAEGHNTLVINPDAQPDQAPSATSRIIRFESGDGCSFAIADLSAAYGRSAKQVHRGIALHRKSVLVQDEISTTAPSDVWWFMHTAAQVSADGAHATLSQGGRSLTARILQPSTARFETMAAEPFPTSPHVPGQQMKSRYSKHNASEVRKLAIHLSDVTAATLAVAFDVDEGVPGTIRPLSVWSLPAQPAETRSAR